MKRTRKKHNAVIKLLPVVDPVRMNAELTCQLSDRPVPPRGGERFLRRRRACWERGVSKSVVLLTGTEGSNPSPSSGESGTNSSSTLHHLRGRHCCRAQREISAPSPLTGVMIGDGRVTPKVIWFSVGIV